MIDRSVRILCGIGAVLGVAACGGAPEDGQRVTPIELDIPRSEIPAPGLCKVMAPGSMARSCEGIEFSAPGGSRIVYRPDDGSRRVVVCYMHVSTVGEIIGVDVFNMDNRRLLEVVQRRGEPAPPDGCKSALDGQS